MSSEIIGVDPFFVIGKNLQDDAARWFLENKYSSIYILTDENTFRDCLPKIVNQNEIFASARVITVQPGENTKSLEQSSRIWRHMMETGADREAVMICLGGGIIGDLGGFVASAFMRGIRCLQMPTSLLAMVDSSIGGKTGINFLDVKNSIGTFQQPTAIFCDTSFLKSLPEDELLAGYAEMIKHALIEGGEHWQSVRDLNPREVTDWTPLIKRSINLKLNITGKDFREKGLREVLNLGHSVAHALEALYLEKREEALMHGFAVAAGLIIEADIASKLEDGLKIIESQNIKEYISRYFPVVRFSENEIERIIHFMGYDKKNKNGTRSFTLLRRPGEAIFGAQPSLELIRKSLISYCHYAQTT